MKIFTDAVNKLTLFYVAALMVVSLSASLAVYKMADSQFDMRLRRQQEAFILRQGPFNDIFRELDELRRQEQSDARADLLFGLFLFNMAVLIGGTYLSYYAAKTTLKPIKDVMDSQNRFTADASHELRTPLSAMKSEIEVALKDKSLKTKEAKELLSSNLEEIDNLEKITSGLLELARLPNGSLKLKKVNLREIAAESKKSAQKQALEKSVTIKFDIENSLFVSSDTTALGRIISILLDNAVKYSHQGGEVKVNAQKQKEKVVVSVIDSGIGIKANDQKKIFDRFFRADTSRTKIGGRSGYGLGLSIAKNLAEQLGTRINVKSVYGKGSNFYFTLNLAS